MEFKPNKFFTNLKLSFIAKKNVDTDEAVEVIGTIIEWIEGKDPSKKDVKKTIRDKKTGEKQVVTKFIACDSFFNVFKSIKEPDTELVEARRADSDDDRILQQLEDANDISNDLYDLYT